MTKRYLAGGKGKGEAAGSGRTVNMGKLLEEIQEYWDQRADGYSRVNQEELKGEQREKWSRLLREHFPDRTPEEIKVLDIGTGPGFFAIILAEQGYPVTAVDYTPEMLEEARRNAGVWAQKIDWRRMDAQELAFADETFDVIVSRNLTWNLEEPEQAYGEWRRVLKRGGMLLNFDANWYGFLFDEKLKEKYRQDRLNVEHMELEDHYTCTDVEWMEQLAKQMPLSPMNRPDWDKEALKRIGFTRVRTEEDIGKQVWSLTEQINYASTPMFCVAAWR